MIVDRISYKKIFPIGSYANETIGLEAEVDVGDDIIDCYKQLKIMAEKLHNCNKPFSDDPNTFNIQWDEHFGDPTKATPQRIPTIDPRAYETAEIGIDNATTIKDLEFYADIAVKYGLVEMYLAKKKTLE